MAKPASSMRSPNANAEADVRIRLTLALSSSPTRGGSDCVRGTPNPAKYLTKNQASVPYNRLPTPVDQSSAEEVKSALRDWEQLSQRTERQLALEMTAPTEETDQRPYRSSEERDGHLTLSGSPLNYERSRSHNEGALVPYSSEHSKLSPYKPTGVARPFRAATLSTAAWAHHHSPPKSTPESRARLLKNALRTAPANPYTNYAESEATVEQRVVPASADSDSECADTVFGSTAFSPLDFEEQKALFEKEQEARHSIVMGYQSGNATLQQAFYKDLMSTLSQLLELERRESQRAAEDAGRREKEAERASAAVTYWNKTLVNRIIALPVVSLTLSANVPTLIIPPTLPPPIHTLAKASAEVSAEDSAEATSEAAKGAPVEAQPSTQPTPPPAAPQTEEPAPFRLDTEAAAAIRCISVVTIEVSPPDELYNKFNSPTASHSRTPSTSSVAENPHEKLWVQHHVEEDEVTTCAIAPPTRDTNEGNLNALWPRTPPHALADEEEYILPAK